MHSGREKSGMVDLSVENAIYILMDCVGTAVCLHSIYLKPVSVCLIGLDG